jgi:hypothetical protein
MYQYGYNVEMTSSETQLSYANLFNSNLTENARLPLCAPLSTTHSNYINHAKDQDIKNETTSRRVRGYTVSCH